MTRMAAGPEVMDIEDWMPSKIYLNVPLMWDILQFNFHDSPIESRTAGLLSTSLTPVMSGSNSHVNEGSMIEIVVATSPEITINTADGGQEAPTLSFRTTGPEASWDGGGSGSCRDEDTLTFNFTPWLYADSSQFLGNVDWGFEEQTGSVGDQRAMAWWEGDSFNNITYNTF